MTQMNITLTKINLESHSLLQTLLLMRNSMMKHIFKISLQQVTLVFDLSNRNEQTEFQDRNFSICNDKFPEVSKSFQSIADQLKVQNL